MVFSNINESIFFGGIMLIIGLNGVGKLMLLLIMSCLLMLDFGCV